MNMRRTLAALGLLSILALPANLGAQAEQVAWPGPAPNPLGLSAAQQSQIQELMRKLQNECIPIWTKLQAKNMELMSLLRSPNADPSAAESKRKEISDLQAELQRNSLEARNAVRGLLTDEQKTLFDQMGLGYGWGRGPCGLGLGPAWGYGGGRGFGRGGRGRGSGSYQESYSGLGPGAAAAGWGLYGPRWGRGPCGMGLGRTGGSPWMGRWPW